MVFCVDVVECCLYELIQVFFFFSSRRRHTRFLPVSWARRCVQETGEYLLIDIKHVIKCKQGDGQLSESMEERSKGKQIGKTKGGRLQELYKQIEVELSLIHI
eukprot:TRINITY_DN16911_c0_g1_i2.p4 TRINITY_DN16911_c0_g1~~TRINITY_DN16911_c0_g1_i2.p4  ORF type:complete len:103 (-),score=16.69 TRINITY_DN16911_c0_g1_i2:127-435(-)